MPWSTSKPDISIIVPAYRAVHRIFESLTILDAFAQHTPLKIELILVDDGSDDGTTEIMSMFAATQEAAMFIRHEKNVGKGRSIADGVAVARGAIVIFTDADLPYDVSIFELIYKRFQANKRINMLVGSRQHTKSKLKNPYSFVRRTSSASFKYVVRLLVGVRATDAQCGIKAFRLDAARLLFSNLLISRFAFDVELFLRAKKYSILFEEVPVIFNHEARSTVSIFSTSIQMISDIVRLRNEYAAHKK